jgi:hypothetical protein
MVARPHVLVHVVLDAENARERPLAEEGGDP